MCEAKLESQRPGHPLPCKTREVCLKMAYRSLGISYDGKCGTALKNALAARQWVRGYCIVFCTARLHQPTLIHKLAVTHLLEPCSILDCQSVNRMLL